MKNFIKVSLEEAEKIMQDIYKYMPMIMFIDGGMRRVVAQNGNNVYYVED